TTIALWFVPISDPMAELRGGSARPPDCVAPSTVILLGDWVLKFQVDRNIVVNAYDSPDSTEYWISGRSDRTSKLEIGEGPLLGAWEEFEIFELQEKDRHVEIKHDIGSGL